MARTVLQCRGVSETRGVSCYYGLKYFFDQLVLESQVRLCDSSHALVQAAKWQMLRWLPSGVTAATLTPKPYTLTLNPK